MLKRSISGAVVAAVVLVLLLIGGIPFWGAGLLLGEFGMFEVFRAGGIETNRLTWIAYPLLAAYELFLMGKGFTPWLMLLILTALLIYLIFFRREKISGFLLFSGALFGVGVLSSSLAGLRLGVNGIFFTMLAFITSWGSDVAAYFVGSLIGKHHIFPELSPKKTTEGCIGGIVFGAGFGALAALLFKQPVMPIAVLSFFASILSEAGDLTASALKRTCGIKDYGSLIPGHGGLLDRFDSTLFTGAFFYICTKILLL